MASLTVALTVFTGSARMIRTQSVPGPWGIHLP